MKKSYAPLRIVATGNDDWAVVSSGAKRALKRFGVKRAALVWARDVAKKRHTTLTLTRRDGTIIRTYYAKQVAR
jgi:hypothetical protein